MYLVLRRESTAKGAKKNTAPNVIRLQYIWHLSMNIEWNLCILTNLCQNKQDVGLHSAKHR